MAAAVATAAPGGASTSTEAQPTASARSPIRRPGADPLPENGCGAETLCAPAAPKGEAYYRRAVLAVSFGCLGIFGGFQPAQGLQTSLNATLGGISLACQYGMFTLLCLVAPPLLAGLERRVGLRIVLLASGTPYVAMVVANVIDTPSEPAKVWAVPIATNLLVGFVAPMLWTAQNVYVSRCSTRAALELAESEEAVEACTALMTTRFNSLFFSIYQFAGMCGNILASSMLLALSESSGARRMLFLTLGAVSALGAGTYLTMPVVADAGSLEQPPSLLDTAHLALTDARMGLLIPLMVTNGMTLAFFLGDFQKDVTCPVAGPAFTGFVIAVYFGVNCVATRCWGRFIEAGRISRRAAYTGATICSAAYLLWKLAWTVPENFELSAAAGSTDWEREADPAWSSIAAVFGLAALFAVGDSFYQSGPPMTLQTFYSGTDKVVPAMANYKLSQSLGMASQFLLGVLLGGRPAVRGLILLAALALSLVCVLWLDRCVAREDLPPPEDSREPGAKRSSDGACPASR